MEYHSAIKAMRYRYVPKCGWAHKHYSKGEKKAGHEWSYTVGVHLHEMSKRGKFIKTESGLVDASSWRWEWEVTANGHKVSYWCDGNVLKLESGDSCISL